MNWQALDALETKYSAINGIMVVDLSAHRVVMANTLALDYFARRDDVISLQSLLGRNTKVKDLFESVKEDLANNPVTVMEEAVVQSKDGDELECDISFTYAQPDKKHVFMTIHPIVDNRPYYLEKFVDTRSRPAFVLNLDENLTVNHGNELFYKSFACNKTSMKLRYKNYFGNLLAEEMRQDYEGIIYDNVGKTPFGILDIPVQTAMGETLYFYFDTLRLRQVEENYRKNLFCMLVKQGEDQETLMNPFDNS